MHVCPSHTIPTGRTRTCRRQWHREHSGRGICSWGKEFRWSTNDIRIRTDSRTRALNLDQTKWQMLKPLSTHAYMLEISNTCDMLHYVLCLTIRKYSESVNMIIWFGLCRLHGYMLHVSGMVYLPLPSTGPTRSKDLAAARGRWFRGTTATALLGWVWCGSVQTQQG